MDIDPQRLSCHPIIAGLLGALFGLRYAPGSGIVDRLVNVAAGATTAGYIAPAAAEVFSLTSPVVQGALAFAIGMFGMSVTAAIMQALRELPLAQIISGWLSRRKG